MIVEYLRGKKCHDLTCCSCGIYYNTALNFSEIFTEVFTKADFMASFFILYNCGNVAENTWIKWVSYDLYRLLMVSPCNNPVQ